MLPAVANASALYELDYLQQAELQASIPHHVHLSHSSSRMHRTLAGCVLGKYYVQFVLADRR
jgi:hypothetical protein